MKYKSIIVLSHELTPDWELSEESKLRVEKGVKLFEKGYAKYIIMNGGPGKFEKDPNGKYPYGKFVPRGSHPVQCEAMKDHAMNLGIPRWNILMQNFSSDTIGEAFFVKQMFLAPNGWHNNIIVTSKFHEKRVKRIYEIVLGNRYLTEFELISKGRDNCDKTRKGEEDKIRRFERDFGDIEPGDSHAFETALYERHDIYSKIPRALRPRFYGDFFISL